ncbi:hypothetical protein BOSEA31B_20762 [Hyphomicrobiales bacterium]|nr:hypothetical protein BOSEA31B_20762 [Hyphomicrobiales bacterium]CAH1702741.1 hypothetical protein BOSEA1005_30613 [Hyphomicrobiales bacterium]CAI0346931.1 hypothetical protein BO1005MUT1_530107 [Hyphomicrobiales bacterium]
MWHQNPVTKVPRALRFDTPQRSYRFAWLNASVDLVARPGEDIEATTFPTSISEWRLTKVGSNFWPLQDNDPKVRRIILSWAAEVGLAPGVSPKRPTSQVAAWEANLTDDMVKAWARASGYDGYVSKVDDEDEVVACTIFAERLPEWTRSRLPAVRATSISGFETTQDAAEAIGDLTRVSLKEFLTALVAKLNYEAWISHKRQLDGSCAHLEEAADLIGAAAKEVGYASAAERR